ncbi:MAG: FtsK/SpoIIIE domain-containing protein [Gemmataceae bacterium]
MSLETLYSRERDALCGLANLAKSRAAREIEIAAAFRAGTEGAEAEINRIRKKLAADKGKIEGELESTHRTTLDSIAQKAATARTEAIRRHADATKKITDKFKESDETTRTRFQDQLWATDSTLEAQIKEAEDLKAKLDRTANEARTRVESIWRRAEHTLSRVKVTREDVFFHEHKLPTATQTDPEGKLERCLEESGGAVKRLEQSFFLKLLGVQGLIIVMLTFAAAGAGIGFAAGQINGLIVGAIVGLVIGFLIGQFGLRLLTRKQIAARGAALGIYLAETSRTSRILEEQAAAACGHSKAKAHKRHEDDREAANSKFKPLLKELKKNFDEMTAKLNSAHQTGLQAIDETRSNDTATATAEYESKSAANAKTFDDKLAEAEAHFNDSTASARQTRDRDWARLESDWHGGLERIAQSIRELQAAGAAFPAWDELAKPDHVWPSEVPLGIRFGEYAVCLEGLPDGIPADPRLKPRIDINDVVPAYLPFSDQSSILLKAKDDGRTAAIMQLQLMMLRFLTGVPPGKVRFTIIDPVGLGENFGSFMHLADADELLVNGRIWTEPSHIEARLAELTSHMETVIQKYLRNQYTSIEEYNLAAGEVAEPYRVLVVANFPTNFTPDAAKRLVSIMSSGPACGVCSLVSVDTRAGLPRDFRLSDLESVSLNFAWNNGRFNLALTDLSQFPLQIDTPPDAKAIASLAKRVGEASKFAAKVEVPFSFIAPKPEEIWKSSADREIAVPVGRAGATRRQLFRLGVGTAQHALVAGKTGSGKSTLLHAFITNLSLYYSPDEVELYLIDFKKGVEFKSYASNRLPHARVIAVESEREFGLSVLQRLDAELRDRGDRFRAAGCNDLAGYRETTQKPLPRILFIVDEFQEFFIEDDKLAQEASLLLDRLVRQGRAFGMHVILGSQTLGGAYSLARSTIDQMAVRVALQCSDADAQLILNKDNTAARLLTRPGEAIYNDANGLVEGNDPFQVVWLSEEQRDDLLGQVRSMAGKRVYPPALVFEGNVGAEISKNEKLIRTLAAPTVAKAPIAWLGDAIAIKDPTAATFRSQSAANLIVIGQQDDTALSTVSSVLISLAGQTATPGSTSMTILDGTPEDAEFADYLPNLAQAIGPRVKFVERGGMKDALAQLADTVAKRTSGEQADRSPQFLVVFGLQRFRDLRKAEDDYGYGRRGEKTVSPADQFTSLIKEGPAVGVHVIVWIDSLTNFNRSLERQMLKEFGQRVLFQMSANDSSNLLDTPVASRLGRNRALLTMEEQDRPEKFRPYALPALEWVRKVCHSDRSTDSSNVNDNASKVASSPEAVRG